MVVKINDAERLTMYSLFLLNTVNVFYDQKKSHFLFYQKAPETLTYKIR